MRCPRAGNLLLQPTAALLFLDFKTGDTLQVSGSADVLHGDTSLPGSKVSVVPRALESVCVLVLPTLIST